MLKDSATAIIIFVGMLAVYWLPAIIAIMGLYVLYKISRSVYRKLRAYNRIRRVKSIEKKGKKVESEYNEEAEFLNSI